MAIIPSYIDQKGDCTILYAKDIEPLVIEKGIRTVFKNIGKHLMIDLREIKKRYSHLVLSSNLVPIPLSKEDIFIPVKTRKPLVKDDGAFGYINIKYIKEINKDKETGLAIITLANNTIIQCLCSLTTVNKYIKSGNIVSRCYQDTCLNVAESETVYNDGRVLVKVYLGGENR